ncbi:PspC domain-containing protein, partial [Escherichia coli]|uniref:PspC domain-containing protein n=2 Tax=Bacteria TaxID=2 RepID=UPI001ADDD145
YRIDPTIVRVAFVVGAVAGGGLVPYLVAILLMPRFSVPQSPGELVFSDIDPASPQAKTLKKERNIGWLLAVAIVLFGGLGVAGEGVL